MYSYPYTYAADAVHVYFNGEVINGVHVETFEIIENGEYDHIYAKDKNTVYYNGKVLIGSNPNTFKTLWGQRYEGCGPGPYSTDGINVYFTSNLVLGADPRSFELFRVSNYAKDKSSVFHNGVKKDGLDPETFIEPECNYG